MTTVPKGKFAPMLSATLANWELVRYPVLVSPKLDGIRVLSRDGRLLSRKLKPIPNRALQMYFGRQEQHGLDGEFIHGDPRDPDAFLRTTKIVMSRDAPIEDVRFYQFDNYSVPELPFKERLAFLVKRIPGYEIVPHTLCANKEAVLECEREALELGFEGVMGRDPDGTYKFGRSTEREGGLWKLKRFEDAEAFILDVVEENANNNEATEDALGHTKRSSHKANKVGKGVLGALTVRGLNGTWKGSTFNIGSGFSAAERAELWNRRDKLLGQIVKYKFFPSGSKDAPRFPTYLGLRLD